MGQGAANERSMQSTLVTTDVIVRMGPGYFWGVMINTDGAEDSTIIIYDGQTTGGIKIFDMTALAADESYGCLFPKGIYCGGGIYADVASAGTIATWVFWEIAS